jgi:hypothetical protein
MRYHTTILITTVLLAGCAQSQAQLPAPVPASAAAPMPAVADSEPDVTARVATLLGQLGAHGQAPEQLTDNARAALGAPQWQQMGAALRPCGNPPALELLARSTKGEDRNYLYRAPCHGAPLLVEIRLGKGDRIGQLAVRRQP